jgi:hypothetical protein
MIEMMRTIGDDRSHRLPPVPSRLSRASSLLAATSAIASTAGCDRAPSYSILGSFFPVWLLCFLVGMLLTFGVHLLLNRLRLAGQLGPPVIVYPSLTALFTMGLWLIFYS